MRRIPIFAMLLLLVAMSAAAKPKHVISNYNHVGILFVHGTGISQHGDNTYHAGEFTCYVYNNPEYGPDCSGNTAILEFRTDDGKTHIVVPTDKSLLKQFDHNVLENIFLDPKNSTAMEGAGVRFRYRVEGNLLYVPIGTVNKHGAIHISGEKAYLL